MGSNPTLSATPSVPAPPSSVSVTRGDGTLSVSWDSVNGATSYNVSTSSAGETTTSKYVGGNSHCTQFSNHGNYFRVRAWNIVWGSWSGWHKHR